MQSELALALALCVVGCGATSGAAEAATPSPVEEEDELPIGQASMEPDGTIVLELHRPAIALHRVAPGDPSYARIREAIGPIPPGGTVPVMPFRYAEEASGAE